MNAPSFKSPSDLQAPIEHGPASRPDAVVDFSPRRTGHALDFADAAPHRRTTAAQLDPSAEDVVYPETLRVSGDESAPLLVRHGPQAALALEAYKGLRTRLLKLQSSQGFRSIAVTSLNRADGKTTTSVNLAYCLAQLENLSVLLIDADLRSRGLSKLLHGLPPIGLHDVLTDSRSFSEGVARLAGSNLYAMGAGTETASTTEMFSSSRWTDLMRWSADHFSVVLVDAISMGLFADLDLIVSQCDRALMVVRSGRTNRENLKNAMLHFDPSKVAGIVFNAGRDAKTEY